MTDQHDDLLEAVLALTDPYDEPLAEPATNRWGRKITHVQRPDRIHQLETAITPSGNRNGGGSLARERNLIDTGALDLYNRLAKDILVAARNADSAIGDDLGAMLKWWLVTVRQKHPTDAFEAEWAGKWRGWAAKIDAHLDPPTIIELMRPCPICGETKALDQHAPGGPAIVTALIVQYRRGNNDEADAGPIAARHIPADSTALCRFCAAVWKGRDAVREVAFDIESAEHEGAA